MGEYEIRRVFKGPLGTGFAALALSFVAANLIWPIWSVIVQQLYLGIMGPTAASLDPVLTKKLTGVVAEGAFFWMVINTWIWMTLVMLNAPTAYPSSVAFIRISFAVTIDISSSYGKVYQHIQGVGLDLRHSVIQQGKVEETVAISLDTKKRGTRLL